MPAWWRWKPKSKTKSTSSIPRKEEEEEEEAAATPKRGGGSHKEKSISFDEALIARKGRDASPVFGGPGFVVRHRLPLPSSISSPLPSVTNSASASASASGSSVSSSGSSEETSDRGVYRYPNSMNMPSGRNVSADPQRHHDHVSDGGRMFLRSPVREHPRCPDISVSPRKELHLHGFDPSTSGTTYSHSQISTDTIFSSRTNSSPPSSRGLPSPTSPLHSRTFILSPSSPIQKQENMRSLPHPLPLPPSSPSNSSRSQQSQWRKGKLLGRGTFGHVYLGFNSETGQMCAIKEVKVISDDSSSRESLKQLNQEITLLSQLSHPNIVQYYGSELADDTLSVYLEYVSGGSIHKLIQEYGAFKEPVIRNYAGQILSGLAYLHGRSTVHRDIKGANILVGTNGEVKLADFGMAKHISVYNSIRSFKGSPYWMAPEVIMNGNGYNLSVDIWSLGCTILEMATSKPPWSQYEGVAAIFKIGNSKDLPEIPDHLSAEGKNFVMLCLQRDPSARPTAVQLMDHPFVREQSTIRAAKSNLTEVYPSSLDGSHIMTIREFSSNRSISPLRDRDIGMRNIAAFPYSFPSSQMNSSIRMNMSLPVSPCSSPLRQFKQSNRSCLPSPPHPAYSAGAINYNPNNHALNPMRPSNTLIDPLPEIAQVKTQSPYGSPRRL